MIEAPADLTFEALHEGDAFEETYVIAPRTYESFLVAFEDRSTLHIDDAFAAEHGFAGRVMHGAILNGFVSHFVGMRVPGKRALLQSVELQYLKPSYLGDTLVLRTNVAQKVEAARAIVLHLQFHNETRGVLVARGRAQVGVLR